MRSKTLSMVLLALLVTAHAAADGISQSVLHQVYQRVDGAAGLIEFSSEITNPNTGEKGKRDRNALGLVVSPDGLIMTHGHMISENNEPLNIRITLGEGQNEREYNCVALPKPDDVNIAFLRIESDDKLRLPYVRFSRENSLGIGAPVAFYGVLGEPFDYALSLLSRRVGAKLDKPRTTYVLDDAVRFGYIGAPVADAQGRLVGVVGYDLSTAEGGELYVRSGHPLIYQTALFQKYIDNPPTESTEEDAEDAWLGVFTQPLTEDFAEYWGLDRDGGLIVSTLVPNSPAELAGIQTGDIIVEFDGTPIRAKADRDVRGFTKLVRETGAGKEVTVNMLRNGEPVSVPLQLGVRPRSERDAQEFEDELLGLTVRELTTDVRIRLNLAEDVQGVIVRRVKSGSAAQLGKIRPGVLILGFGDFPVKNLEDYRAVIERIKEAKPKEIVVFGRAGAATGFFRLEPRWKTDGE